MGIEKLNSQEIIDKIRKGDEQAFDKLFTQFYPGLLRYARFLIPYPSDEAEDIVSEVFCNLWVNREKLYIKTSVASYLYRAVKNKTINTHKKGKLNTINLEDSINDIPPQPQQAPDDLLAYKQFDERLSFLIKKLPEKTRLVFLMSRDEGLTYEEIAKVLDVSINTIKTQMFRAIRFLKGAFNPDEYINILIISMILFF